MSGVDKHRSGKVNRGVGKQRGVDKHRDRKPIRASECPVARQALQVQSSAEALAVSLQHLKRMLHRCRGCPAAFNCPAMVEFNRAFETALQEVNETWSQGAAS